MPKKREKTRENKQKWSGLERKNSFGATDLTPFNVQKLKREKQDVVYK